MVESYLKSRENIIFHIGRVKSTACSTLPLLFLHKKLWLYISGGQRFHNSIFLQTILDLKKKEFNKNCKLQAICVQGLGYPRLMSKIV